jgi:hypothetical protein
MPFIRGRYHINGIAGEALEAAREAEAALLALDQDSEQGGGDDNDGGEAGAANNADRGPIHRIEIDAAALVPSHSGRAQRGFVARVHRESAVDAGSRAGSSSDSGAQRTTNGGSAFHSASPGHTSAGAYAARPETHVFGDHRDLRSFLKDEFAKDCKR